MIIKAKHHIFIYPFFRFYTIYKIKKHFHKIVIHSDFKDRQLPLLVVSNHMSWWDGFWLNYLNAKLFHRKFHFMMLENQLLRYWFFQFAGGYSIKKGARSIGETLSYTSGLLEDNQNMVLIFPQGEIQSLYTSDFQFERGLESILRQTISPVQILFVANLIEYFSRPKPSCYIYVSEYKNKSHEIKSIQSAYNDFYNRSKSKNLEIKDV